VKSKTEVLLSHIITLEKLFDSYPTDVVELRRRDKLIEYATIPLHAQF
jgi:hypothetical protein